MGSELQRNENHDLSTTIIDTHISEKEILEKTSPSSVSEKSPIETLNAPDLKKVSAGCNESNATHPAETPSEKVQQESNGSTSIKREKQKESWRRPGQNTWRLLAVCWAFLNFGLNDASYGALLPTLESYYQISYTLASLLFLSTFLGYSLSALFSDLLHVTLGRLGAAFLSPLCRIIAYILLSLHLPYPAIIVGLVICGIGNGITEGAWNAWLGGLENSNELLGILHGMYGLGATVAPVVATGMVDRGWGWWRYYAFLAGMNGVEVVGGLAAWWGEGGRKFREGIRGEDAEGEEGKEGGRMKEAAKSKIVWLIAGFFFCYVGAEVSLGGFIPSFLLTNRSSPSDPSTPPTIFTASLGATGFWAGLTVGRVTLGFITARIGERLAISIYLVLATGLQLIFWLVPNFGVSVAAVSLLGFFIGPMFPSGVVVGTKILPERLHVAGIAFASTVGGAGASILPFAVGAIAQARGVAALEPIVVAVLAVLLGIWLCLPRVPKGERGKEKEEEKEKEREEIGDVVAKNV